MRIGNDMWGQLPFAGGHPTAPVNVRYRRISAITPICRQIIVFEQRWSHLILKR
jgi:hypothetical protein